MTATPTDLAARLQEVSTLLALLEHMEGEPGRETASAFVVDAIDALCDDPDVRLDIIRQLLRLIAELTDMGAGRWCREIAMLGNVIRILAKVPGRPLTLCLPTLTDKKGNPIVANYPLSLANVATFTITELNTVTGAFDPVNPADVFTAAASDTTNLSATIGTNAAGAPALVVNWLHTTSPLLTGVSVTISDSLGNTNDVQLFDMIQPATLPDQIGLDVTDVTLETQPVPV